MKNLILGWLSIAVVLSLFICAPLPVLACGGGGGGGGGGEAGLGGPQSSTASSPTSSTFTKPTSSTFGRPGAAAYVGGINFGSPATINGASGSAYNPRLQSDGHWRPNPTFAERQQRLVEEAEAYHGGASIMNAATTSAEYAAIAGTIAQAGIAIATSGASSWLTTFGKILLSGARGAADGYAYAAEKREGGEASQAALSGGAAATVEIVTSPVNPLIGVGGSVIVDEFMHKDALGRLKELNMRRARAREEKQAENRSGLSFDVSITDRHGVTRHYGGGTR